MSPARIAVTERAVGGEHKRFIARDRLCLWFSFGERESGDENARDEGTQPSPTHRLPQRRHCGC